MTRFRRAALVAGLTAALIAPAVAQAGPGAGRGNTGGRAKVAPPRHAPKPARRAVVRRPQAKRHPAKGRPVAGKARISVTAVRNRPEMRDLGRRPDEVVDRSREQILADTLREQWSSRTLRRGTTAIFVVDAVTGKPIYAVHEDLGLNPASNVKLVSTATVLSVLGPEWRYTTKLLGPAPDLDGVVRGDLYLLGSGDPTLAPSALGELAESLAATGVRRVEGDLLASDDPLRDSVGLPRLEIRVRSGAAGAAPTVAIDPASDFVTVESTATVTTRGRRPSLRVDSHLIDDAGAPRLVVTIAGAMRPNRDLVYTRSVRRPVWFTLHTLRAALHGAGIEVTGGPRLADLADHVSAASAAGYLPIELARHESAPIGTLVRRVNKRSLNFMADRLLMTAGGVAAGEPATMGRGIKAMRHWLRHIGVPLGDVVLDTGSGLSRQTKLSARQIVEVLRSASGYASSDAATLPDGLGEQYLSSLSIAGVDGTLGARFRNTTLAGKLVGKTGTLHDVVALSGFVSTGPEDTLCFAIISNGHRDSAKVAVRDEHGEMVRAMLAYLEARHGARERKAAESGAPVADAAADTAAVTAADAVTGADTVTDTDIVSGADTDTDTDTGADSDGTLDSDPDDVPPPDDGGAGSAL